MTDLRLIKRLRDFGHIDAYQAADRIEELNERLTATTDDAEEAEAYAQELEERNKELTLQLLATSGQAADALDKAVVAEAKLTKAVEERDEYKAAAEICGKAARAMLAELEGK